jgi:hypothetical protein
MDQHHTASTVPGQEIATLSPQLRSPAEVDRLDSQVTGMTCAHCAGRITQAGQLVLDCMDRVLHLDA